MLTAIHLLGRSQALRIVLVEKSRELGAGAAYSTDNPDHLLNVRASNMSAFPDDPDHFTRWLTLHGGRQDLSDPGCFAPRRLYRDYLAGQLASALATGRLVRVEAEALAATESDARRRRRPAYGGARDGRRRRPGDRQRRPEPAARPMAAGRLGLGARRAGGTRRRRGDRRHGAYHGGSRPNPPACGASGSHHGSVPAWPAAAGPSHGAARGAFRRRDPLRGAVDRAHGLDAVARQRIEAEGGDWRSLVDGLRPHTRALWQHLPLDQRRRFLRHARAFWDCHRHRVAPEAARRLEEARATGQLGIVAAHVARFEPLGEGVDVHLVARGTGREKTIRADAVYECRGRATDVTASSNPILQAVLRSGLARPDPLGLGLDVAADNALVGAGGVASRRMFAVGPVTSGVYWEVVAIPDIRTQAAALAERLAGADQGGI